MKMEAQETMTSNDFYKTRSYSGCIGAAFNLFCANFATIFKKTWLPAMVFAIVCGLYAFTATNIAAGCGKAATPSGMLMVLGLELAITVCALVANSRTKAGFLSLVNGCTMKQNFIRHLKATAVLAACIIVAGIVSLAANMVLTHFFISHKTPETTAGTILMCSSAAVAIILAVTCTPFAYSMTRFLMHNTKAGEMFGKHYRAGFKRLGFLLVIGIIVALIMLVVNAFMALPAYIITTASQIDGIGVCNGDPTGLPTYFTWLSFFTIAIVSFILTYTMFWTDLVLCYAYGTIEADATEEAEMHKTGE